MVTNEQLYMAIHALYDIEDSIRNAAIESITENKRDLEKAGLHDEVLNLMEVINNHNITYLEEVKQDLRERLKCRLSQSAKSPTLLGKVLNKLKSKKAS